MENNTNSALLELHPTTRVLTEGFDPHLSVGSARPAVFRSSTYVFSTPEAAERAFNITSGRAQRAENEQVDLIYSRFNHPMQRSWKSSSYLWSTERKLLWSSIPAWPPLQRQCSVFSGPGRRSCIPRRSMAELCSSCETSFLAGACEESPRLLVTAP